MILEDYKKRIRIFEGGVKGKSFSFFIEFVVFDEVFVPTLISRLREIGGRLG